MHLSFQIALIYIYIYIFEVIQVVLIKSKSKQVINVYFQHYTSGNQESGILFSSDARQVMHLQQ